MLIELSDVSIVRGNTRILDSLTLRVPCGQHIAIVGPNGSGKSTFLKLLMKFFYPSVVDGVSGTVKILGQEEWNVWELREHLGFVSSDIDHHFTMGRSARLTALQSTLTGYFAAELEPEASTISTAMLENAKCLLDRFQVDYGSKKCIGNMSTGERRRVLLARALVRNPQAIVLDEPTNGLDIRARSEFLCTLEQLARSGTQIVLVTHHLEEILPCIDRTILLKEGRVFKEGATPEALCAEVISALFESCIRVERGSDGFYFARYIPSSSDRDR